jgi:hypothetical protein
MVKRELQSTCSLEWSFATSISASRQYERITFEDDLRIYRIRQQLRRVEAEYLLCLRLREALVLGRAAAPVVEVLEVRRFRFALLPTIGLVTSTLQMRMQQPVISNFPK